MSPFQIADGQMYGKRAPPLDSMNAVIMPCETFNMFGAHAFHTIPLYVVFINPNEELPPSSDESTNDFPVEGFLIPILKQGSHNNAFSSVCQLYSFSLQGLGMASMKKAEIKTTPSNPIQLLGFPQISSLVGSLTHAVQ
jgi:hypothetical protein